MRESDKGMKGDHRNMSDPTTDRKDFIKHVAENAAKDASKEEMQESKITDNKQKERPGNQKH